MSIFGVRFHALGQTDYYSAPDDCKHGDQVIIEADQAVALGEIVSGPIISLPGFDEADLPVVLRMANAEDKETGRRNAALAAEAMRFCRERIRERRLDMKLVDVEVFFDRSKLIFYFTAPVRIDFRELVKDLVREYRARIELRQIGVRHETQMLGAVGNCGMVCCCRRYLRKFAPVTIRMAKEQNLFLNPAKISGICGRLLCCLSYEQENYERFHRNSPRPGKKYQTARGILKVLHTNMFRNSLSALTEENEEVELTLEEWEALEPRRPDAPPTPAADGRRPAERGRRASGELPAPESGEPMVEPPLEDDFALTPNGMEEKQGSAPADRAPQRRGRKHKPAPPVENSRRAAHAGPDGGSPARKDGRHAPHAAHAPHAPAQGRKA